MNANNVDPDQILHSAAFDLGLHCVPVTLLEISKVNWTKSSLTWKESLVVVLDYCQTTLLFRHKRAETSSGT